MKEKIISIVPMKRDVDHLRIYDTVGNEKQYQKRSR